MPGAPHLIVATRVAGPHRTGMQHRCIFRGMKHVGPIYLPTRFAGSLAALVFAPLVLSAAQSPGDGRPIARIKESIICCPAETIVLDGWASIDLDGEVRTWHWDLNGNGTTDTVTTRGEVRFAAPQRPQLFSVFLTVKDNEGNVSLPHSVSVHVMNTAPKVRLLPDTTVKVGVRVAFAPTVTVSCGTIDLYEWDFDDDGVFEYRSRENGATSRVYHKAGTYRARFRVTDSMGIPAGGIRTITVLAAQPR